MEVIYKKLDLYTVIYNRNETPTTQAEIDSARRVFNTVTAVFVLMEAIAKAHRNNDQDAYFAAQFAFYAAVVELFDRSPEKMITDLNRVLAWNGFPLHIIEGDDEKQAS